MRTRLLIALLTLSVPLAAAASAHAASLDPSFGSGGRVVLDFGDTTATAGDLALQPDGRLVAVGWINGSFGLVRLLPGGALDPSFGSGGVAITGFGAANQNQTPPRLALQPDGRIVVAGPGVGPYTLPNGLPSGVSQDFAVMRLLPDGSFDPSFGQGGKATFPLSLGPDVAQALALQPDGKIVVAGYTTAADGTNSDFAAIRLTPGGRLDTGFGSDGQAIVPMIPDSGMDSASAVALLPDGGILLGGVTARPDTGFDVAVVRLTSEGRPDPGFGDQGRAVLALGGGAWQEIVRRLAVLPGGSFYVAGSALQPGFGPSEVALTRFTAAGTPDASFASGGWLLRALGTVEDTSNGIVVDGARTYLAVDSRVAAGGRMVGVLALDQAGNPDEAFGSGGTLLFHMTAAGDDRAAGIVRRPDGALVELANTPTHGGPIVTDTFAFAAILPRSAQPVAPPPPQDTTPAAQPVAPVSVISSPRRNAKYRRVTLLRGTASGKLRVERVEIALVRTSGRARAARTISRCWYLRSAAPAFRVAKPRAGKCAALAWRRASGTTQWRYRLRRALPKGSYVLYSRAAGGGLREAQGKPGARNRVAFTVR